MMAILPIEMGVMIHVLLNSFVEMELLLLENDVMTGMRQQEIDVIVRVW